MLNELERLEKTATPGPWKVEQWVGRTVIGLPRARYPHTQYVCQVGGAIDRVGGSKEANAALIAAARNALPALLRVARAADNGEWHSSEDCRTEGRAAGCELCQALAALNEEAP